MLQPTLAGTLYGSPTLVGMGTTARLLPVAPPSNAGARFWAEEPPEVGAALSAYGLRLTHFLGKAPPTEPDDRQVLKPDPLPLSAAALAEWVRFYNATEREIGGDSRLAVVSGFASKLPEVVGRLAAVLQLYEKPTAREVGVAAMQAALALGRFYTDETIRLHGASAVSPDLDLAARVLAWWRKRANPNVYLSLIYDRGVHAVGDAATARRIVGILEEHRQVRRLPAGAIIDGKPRRDAWTLA